MEHLVEILKLVEASIQSDRKKAFAYGEQLAKKLEKTGDVSAASRIRKLLGASGSATGSSGVVMQERLPVDGESRLSLADEAFYSADELQVIMSSEVESVIAEFLTFSKASDRLIAAGVGVSPSLLMYGPPGCGKTELAKYVAAQLELPLVTARADTLISSYLGSTAKNLRLLFDHASSRPCVLFLDEFDAIAKLRDDRHELGELKRVVVSVLQNIDAAIGHTVILAATNHEHLLDPAIWRRFAYRVKIALPDDVGRQALFQRFLRQGLVQKTLVRFGKASEGLSGSDIRDICEAAIRDAVLKSSGDVQEYEVLRRLLVRSMTENGLTLPELFTRAKALHPDVYTHRVLAAAFGMSAGNVTHVLRKHALEEVAG